MPTFKHGMLLTIILLAAACSSGEDDEKSNTDSADNSEQSNVIKDQLKVLDKVKEVEKVLQDSAQKAQKAADEQ
jgi:uncharacterized membrane protein